MHGSHQVADDRLHPRPEASGGKPQRLLTPRRLPAATTHQCVHPHLRHRQPHGRKVRDLPPCRHGIVPRERQPAVGTHRRPHVQELIDQRLRAQCAPMPLMPHLPACLPPRGRLFRPRLHVRPVRGWRLRGVLRVPPQALLHPRQAFAQPHNLCLLLGHRLLLRAERGPLLHHQLANRSWRSRPVASINTGGNSRHVGHAIDDTPPCLTVPPPYPLNAYQNGGAKQFRS